MARNNTEFAMLANLLGLKNGQFQPGRSDLSMDEIGQLLMPIVGRGVSVAMPGVNDLGDLEAGFGGMMDLLFPSENTAVSSITPSNTAAPAAQQTTPRRTYAQPAVRPTQPINYRREMLNAGITGGQLRKFGKSDAEAYKAFKAGQLKGRK